MSADDAVEECESCTGRSLKINGLCVLHYVAREYDLGDFRRAAEEVEGLAERRRRHRDSREEFKMRADAALPERWVSTRTFSLRGLTDGYRGENIYWSANPVERNPDAYHSDKRCPYFPEGRVLAYPGSYIRGAVHALSPCTYCVSGGGSP